MRPFDRTSIIGTWPRPLFFGAGSDPKHLNTDVLPALHKVATGGAQFLSGKLGPKGELAY